ncbi:MAG: metal-dependent hydrolase [Myxococcota bacterium]
MANYHTHVTYGFVVGVGTATAAKVMNVSPQLGWDVIPIGGFLGFLGGMIPDIDHDTGIALDTISALLSTVIPIFVLMSYGTSHDLLRSWVLLFVVPLHYVCHVVLKRFSFWHKRTQWREPLRAVAVAAICAIPALFFFRKMKVGYFAAWIICVAAASVVQLCVPLLRRISRHRGSMHSVPFAVLFAVGVYMYFRLENTPQRLVLTLCAFAGVLSHLILDEIYAVDFEGRRLKRSFGTAFSFWKKDYAEAIIAFYALSGLGIAFSFLY